MWVWYKFFVLHVLMYNNMYCNFHEVSHFQVVNQSLSWSVFSVLLPNLHCYASYKKWRDYNVISVNVSVLCNCGAQNTHCKTKQMHWINFLQIYRLCLEIWINVGIVLWHVNVHCNAVEEGKKNKVKMFVHVIHFHYFPNKPCPWFDRPTKRPSFQDERR